MKAFESFHPVVILCYFISVIFVTMFTMNPILLAFSFLSSVIFAGMLIGAKELFKSLAYSFPIMIIMAVTNPIFVHKGETILFFLNDNPVTLEAILYGINISFMIISVFYWFKCYNKVMTSDKFIYLFGKTIPKISLMLSMILNFVPKLKLRFNKIKESQMAMGLFSSVSIIDRLKSNMKVLSILLTWSIENSVSRADSMNARGYGLKGRTGYSTFKWTKRDTIMMVAITFFTTIICMLLGFSYGKFEFYPIIKGWDFSLFAIILYITWVFLTFIGFISEIKENILWRLLKSKI